MRLMPGKGTENTPARKAGNLLMIVGVIVPIVGIAATKFVEFEFDTYRRVIQVIFITGLVLFICGILVKNYWKGPRANERYDPAGLWSDANRVVQEKQFDWTGVGCALMVLGPGIFFIVGFLFAQEFEYAAVVGFACVAVFLTAGAKLFGLGRRRRAQAKADEKAANALATHSDASAISGNTGQENLPQIAPLTTPEGFVLVDASEGVTCGIPFLAIFTGVWYGATFLFLFFVIKYGGEDTGKGVGFLSLFLLAGLLPLYFLIRLVKMARSFEKRAELLVPHWPFELGDEVEMSFQCNLKKPLTVMSVDMTLECQKVEHGSETRTTTVDTRSLSVRDFKQQDNHVTGKWQIAMPDSWTPPYKSENEELNWKANVVVELAEGPKGVFNFPLLVIPKRGVERLRTDAEIPESD